MSSIKQWYDNIKQKGSTSVAGISHYVGKGSDTFRHGAESIATGIALGAMASVHNLDVNIKSLTIPIDGAIGVGAMFASMTPGFKQLHKDLSNIGATALGIAAFRKTQFIMHVKKNSATHHGELNWGAEDPLIVAARALG